ncbi:ADP-glucose phosphorylase isoform X4 [Cryptomeria japonica]|uniref:ADP-glucose phosphorylase isoform X4 n=1 Tax=Cryptomeria japonica TaxID=3369 RepID=UPI0027DA5969|nr:ADP-glucose phosphorylase isoform X4 [Cryptomeria japonica]
MLCSTFHEYAAAFKIFKLPIHPITVQTTQFSRSAMAGAETPKLAGSELRHDSILNKWVIISPARGKRPSDFKSTVNTSNQSAGPCPFCLHHEHECAPEIFRIPENVSEWKVRVIKNLYPAVSMENREKEPHIDSCADTLPGFGSHDVIIETPDHAMTLAIMPDLNIFDVLCAYRTRIQQLAGNLHIKYIQVFKNHGETAGASMKHSHSQIIALPIVPSNVVTRLNNAKEYFTRTMKCNLSSFPFETWIAPKEHASRYEQIEDEQAMDLAYILRRVLQKLNHQLGNPPYNYMIHSSPLGESYEPSYCHWFIQLVPQLTRLGGFEIASGCYINPIFPENIATILRGVNLQNQ